MTDLKQQIEQYKIARRVVQKQSNDFQTNRDAAMRQENIQHEQLCAMSRTLTSDRLRICGELLSLLHTRYAATPSWAIVYCELTEDKLKVHVAYADGHAGKMGSLFFDLAATVRPWAEQLGVTPCYCFTESIKDGPIF